VNVQPRRSLFFALVACAVWLGVHEIRVVGFDGISLGPLSSRFAHDVVLLIAAGACLLRAATVRIERTAWLLIGIGVLGWTFGEIYYTAVLWTASSPPIPSPADIGYLVFPVATFAGMIFLVRGRAKFTPALLVDGIATALAVAALSAAIVFQTVLDHASGDLPSVITSLAYPVTDLILAAVAVGALASTGWRVDRTWALLTGGILLFWFADSMYLVRTAEGVYEAGGWFDAGWWGGLVMIAVAAWQPAPLRRVRCAGDSLRLIAAPLASGAIALELLVYGSLVSLNPLAVGLAAAALVFVMIRLTMTFRQNVRILRASRDEAMTDALTGLGNRRALTVALDEAFAEVRDDSPLVLALFDLDGFKHYNDTFGHPAGDILLTRLGANLRKYLGTRGTVFRMGGDEFCALFTLHAGQDRVELLDGAALALSEHGDGFWIGCSYGSIAVPGEATDAAEALRIADQRMYAQKHAGRASPSRQVKEALLSVLAARDPETIRHARAVATLVDSAATHLGLDPDDRETVRLAAELHEAGRLMLPSGSSPDDVALAGERMIAATPALAPAAHLIGALHERWDGSGFPHGRAGEEIPLGARIVAVADALETMSADRTPTEALAELQRAAGTQFDPNVVAAFTATASPRAVGFVLS
jgi:diguanylate cyclase (GGDEF)-like protein